MDAALVELLLFAGLLIVCWRYAKRLEKQNAEHRRAREAAEAAKRETVSDAAKPR